MADAQLEFFGYAECETMRTRNCRLRGLAATVSWAATALVVFAGNAAAEPPMTNQPADSMEGRIPRIEMVNVPLSDAIKNLARQMDVNYILDPRIFGPDGIFRSDPPLTVRWENISAEEALRRVLADHQLAMVADPATSVARIMPTNLVVKPVPASKIGTDTNAVIPLMTFDEVPLAEAIRQIASQAHLDVEFDPATSSVLKRADAFHASVTVSFRWRNLTARQALAALLDNHGLVMAGNPDGSSARIALKTPNGEVRH